MLIFHLTTSHQKMFLQKYAVLVIVESSFITNNHFTKFCSLIFDQIIKPLCMNILNLIY